MKLSGKVTKVGFEFSCLRDRLNKAIQSGRVEDLGLPLEIAKSYHARTSEIVQKSLGYSCLQCSVLANTSDSTTARSLVINSEVDQNGIVTNEFPLPEPISELISENPTVAPCVAVQSMTGQQG